MNENYITCRDENGSINISEEVITSLVRTGIMEVEGVAGLANTTGTEIAELMGIKTAPKGNVRGVKVRSENETIIVDVMILVNYGSNIVAVGKNVQEKILNVVQTSTGMDKVAVNVHVSGISFEK